MDKIFNLFLQITKYINIKYIEIVENINNHNFNIIILLIK